MYLLIDLAIDEVELAEPTDLKRVHAAVAHGTDVTEVARVLEAAGAGRLADGDEEHLWVATEWIRRRAEGRVSGGWFDDFDAMVTKTREHGGADDSGTHLRVNLEWTAEEDELG